MKPAFLFAQSLRCALRAPFQAWMPCSFRYASRLRSSGASILGKSEGGKRRFLNNQKGQSVVEYMLVLCVIVSAVLLVLKLMRESDFFYKNVTEPLVRHITYNYKYGHPGAQGWDEGNPKLHIQISRPNEGQTFRLFQPTGD